MILVRLAVVYYDPNPKSWKHWTVEVNGVTVEAYKHELVENKLRTMVMSKIKLEKLPEITAQNVIVIPEKERKETEKSIEILANMVSVSEMCERSISSATPCIAFIPETKEELEYLEKTRGFETSLKPIINFRFSISDTTIANDLEDRLDGVSLVAEAISQSSALGKLHEFIRLFERAFKRQSKELIEPLSLFLNPLKYETIEINDWIYKYRHPLTHAVKNEFILESEVRPIIPRLQQAAYDILFNKAIWHSPDVKRRDVLKLKAGSKSQSVSFVNMKETPDVNFELLDHYMSYPIDFTSFMEFPDGWWAKPIENTNDRTGVVDPTRIDINSD